MLLIFSLMLPAMASHAAGQSWDGWVIGEPCAATYQVSDCPLRHIDHPILLLEDGRKLAFLHGEGRNIASDALDKAYGKKVRLTGEMRDGVLHPVKLDIQESSGERKFFKGCL